MKRIKTKHLLKNTRSKILLGLLLVLLLGATAWAIKSNDNDKTDTTNAGANTSQNQTPNGASPNLSPPTAQDKAANDAHKDALVQQQNSPGSAQGNDAGKSAVITSANSDAVRALVSGVVEDGGTCTFVFTQGANTVTKTFTGVANVSTTICALLNPGLKGSWNVALSYTSSTTSVKSSAVPYKGE